MEQKYSELIASAKDGGILNAMLAAQRQEGFLSEQAVNAIAEGWGLAPADVYETASFYSMIRFTPGKKVELRVCRGTACHTAGGAEFTAALEKLAEENGDVSFGFVECLGQCQAAPAVLINGVLHTGMTADEVKSLVAQEVAK